VAGRPRNLEGAFPTTPSLSNHHPVHVTLRVAPGVPSLRRTRRSGASQTRSMRGAIGSGFATQGARSGYDLDRRSSKAERSLVAPPQTWLLR